jgi:predicted metal-binding protein
MKTEVMEHKGGEGRTVLVERLESMLDVESIPCDMDYKTGCGPCEMRGKNLACPPHSPYLPEYIGGSKKVMALCFRVPLEQFPNHIPEERYRNAYEMVRDMLYEELISWRGKGHTVAGSGPCHSCRECVAIKGGKECIFPEKRVYSLESMGVSVVLFSEAAFGLSLDWSGQGNSAGFVSAIGAVFM